ncbi:MAG: hypothetical protein IPN88_09045 [Bacteroidetes bacterium]|nr:hypothetical protein [Bacteroidota bacterium]
MAELLLNGKNFTIDAYSNLLDSLPYTYLKIDFDNFNLEKIDKLLAKNVLSLTTDNYNGLKSYGREISTRLLETHQNKFVISYADFTLDSEDWLLFFKSKKLLWKAS